MAAGVEVEALVLRLQQAVVRGGLILETFKALLEQQQEAEVLVLET
jgi:hypothetical protein